MTNHLVSVEHKIWTPIDMRRYTISILLASILLPMTVFSETNSRSKRFSEPSTNVQIETFPWITRLFHAKGPRCSSIFVSDRHLLTAAHCLIPESKTENLEAAFLNAAEPFKIRAVRYIILPDYYGDSSYLRFITDLAIIELESPILSITPPNIVFSVTCFKHSPTIPNPVSAGYADGELKLAELKWVSRCDRNYQLTYSGSSQDGDSGAPLFYVADNEAYVLGYYPVAIASHQDLTV